MESSSISELYTLAVYKVDSGAADVVVDSYVEEAVLPAGSLPSSHVIGRSLSKWHSKEG
jgi:hypothetical protein